jgi:hypothetical protein
VVPWGVVEQLVVMQFRVPVRVPLTIPTDDPFTVKVCCQSSVQLPPAMQVDEQLRIVSLNPPLLFVLEVAGEGFWPHALLVVHTPLVQESCSATDIPASRMGDFVESSTV